jgi:hypothetical protein
MKPPIGYTRDDLVRCVRRELDFRARVFPRQIEIGRMSQRRADDEMALMRAVLEVLLQLPEEPPAQAGLFRAEPRR